MISDTIKTLRERANMSQAALAKKLDVTRSSVKHGKWDCQHLQRNMLSV